MLVELTMIFVVDEGDFDSDGSEEGFFFFLREERVLMTILTALRYLPSIPVHN